jgi:hypothetical protein
VHGRHAPPFMAADMAPTESEAARRRAEVLWQQHTQGARPSGTATRIEQPRDSSDVKTKRLRMLRLSKEAANPEAAQGGLRARRVKRLKTSRS